MDDATRVRLENAASGTWPILTLSRGDLLDLLAAYDALTRERDAHVAHLEEGMRMMTALQVERAQSGRVLEQLEQWVRGHLTADPTAWDRADAALREAYGAWRAAREE